MKKIISWMILCIGILCIYISMANMLNQNNSNSLSNISSTREKDKYINNIEEKGDLIIEDELVPGGAIVQSNQVKDKKVAFYLISVMLTGIGILDVSKNKI